MRLTKLLLAAGIICLLSSCKNNDANFYYTRGMDLLQEGKVNDAILDFTKATELDDSQVAYFTVLGDAYFMNGDVGNSYSALQKALKLDAQNLEALLKMGEISFYSKDYDRALETLTKVTSIDKENQTAFFMKAFIYKEMGDTANAVQLFRHVIELYPDYAPAYEELGLIYANEKNILGEEYLTTAINLDPENVNALYALALLYQDVELADKANEVYVKLLEIDPQHKWAWHNRGWMAMVLYEDYDAAIGFFTQAIDADNQFVEAHTNRAVAYEAKGDLHNARLGFQAALQIDPDYEPAQQGLKRCSR